MANVAGTYAECETAYMRRASSANAGTSFVKKMYAPRTIPTWYDRDDRYQPAHEGKSSSRRALSPEQPFTVDVFRLHRPQDTQPEGYFATESQRLVRTSGCTSRAAVV